jgi:tetratricopeptide (TPR) repeat protein
LRSIVDESRPRLAGAAEKLRALPKKAWYGIGGGTALAFAVTTVFLLKGKPEPPPPAPPKPVEAAPAPAPPPPKVDAEASYFVVGPELSVATCETLAGPSNEPATSAPIYLKQGRKALVSGEMDKALGFLCRAAILDSSPVPAESVAQLYLARRSHTQAERWAKVALDREPGRRTVLELIADIEVDRGNVELALARLLESMKLTESDMLKRAAVSRNLIKESRVVEKAGDRARAGRLLRRAYLLDPKSAEPSVRLAIYFNSLSEFGLSERWAKRAVELAGDSSEARILLGEFALTAGDRVMAADHFSKVGVAEKFYDRAQEKLRQLK